MKLIESKVEYLPQEEGLEGVYKQIELCGRVSYKSEDKITEDSAEPFVKRLIDSHHYAVLEHGTIHLYFKECCYSHDDTMFIDKYSNNKYSKVIRIGCDDNIWPDGTYHDIMGGKATGDSEYVITTNHRVLVENNWLDDFQYLCSPTEFHEKRYTFKFTCSRAIANELIRHRAFSFMQESQRFVNYSKNKFGNEITFVAPTSFPNMLEEYQNHFPDKLTLSEIAFLECLRFIEHYYMHLLKDGWTPQQARDVLPNATKTELIMTGFLSDWRYLLDLRLFEKTGAVHPDMLDLMKKLQKVAEEAGIWDDIMKYPSKFG